MSFDDLVRERRKGRAGTGTAEMDPEAAMGRARATLDTTLGKTGVSAVMLLASHGVPSVPVGHIKRRFGFDYPEQTSNAWAFPRGLYLLRDGTWWQVAPASAGIDNAPPPMFRWAMSEDPHSPGTILQARSQLTGDVLQQIDPFADDSPCGVFVTGEERTLDFWVMDGVVRVAEAACFELSQPFEDWAADHAATLIDSR